MAASDSAGDESLYPIAILIDELKNEDVQVKLIFLLLKIIQKPKTGDIILHNNFDTPVKKIRCIHLLLVVFQLFLLLVTSEFDKKTVDNRSGFGC